MNNTKIIVGNRFDSLLKALNHSIPSFAKALGYERCDKLYNIQKGKYYPSFEILQDITKYFVDVNTDWIISGRGSMLRTDNIQQPVEPTSASASSDAVVLRLMDKLDDKETENKHLQSELRTMEKELVALKTIHSQFQDKESEHKSRISEAMEAFTLESSGGSGEDFLPTKPPTTSKRSSAGKM